MVRDAERHLVACRELKLVVVVAPDGGDVFRLHVWDKDSSRRKLGQDPEMHTADEFTFMKTRTPRWLQWFASLR